MDSITRSADLISILKVGINFLIQPLNIFWVGIVLFLWFNHRNKKWANIFLYSSLLWLLATGTRWLPNFLVYSLEKRYDVFTPIDITKYKGIPILVLGGGSTYDVRITPQERLSHTSLARLNEGIRLYHELPESQLLFSGFASKKGMTQAAITRDAAVSLGVDPSHISILEEPATTEEEAFYFKKKFGEKFKTLILVTSDIHMPRSMYLFQKAGLNPIAAPADHILKRSYGPVIQKNKKSSKISLDQQPDSGWKTNKNNFDKCSATFHEYIGIMYAKLH
ncbi:MAG: ElyC/SanA/YdcF family protein [Saprospiraceae bacterium]